MRRRLRLAAVLAALAVATGACRMSVDVVTTLHAGGDGSFRMVFAFDKEFVDLVQSSKDGKASLAQIRSIGAAFSGSGWKVATTEPDGGLRIEIERAFSKPSELRRALDEVAARSSGPLSFVNIFRDFSVEQDRGFLSSASRVSGSVDLSPERLVPKTKAGAELQAALQQAALQVFRFTVTAHLPSDVGSYDGDPARLDGPTIAWDAPFGRTTHFAAEAGGVRPSALALVGVPIAALLAGAGMLLVRGRRRRGAPVQGWEVGAARSKPDDPPEPAVEEPVPAVEAREHDVPPEPAPDAGS